jgi:hypothetical protein
MRSRSFRAVALAASTVLAATLIASTTASAIGPGAKAGVRSQGAAQGGPNCSYTGGPAQPLELNTVAVRSLFKTVVMEKEIFRCAPAGGPQSVVDLQTFIEVYEQPNGDAARPPFRFGQVRCAKLIGPGTIRCVTPTIANQAVPAPLVNCGPAQNAADPVEMNTAVIGVFVKTITVEKEWAKCPNSIIRDVYLFTELIERYSDPASGPPQFSVPKVTTWGIVCYKHEPSALIRSCGRFPTTD